MDKSNGYIDATKMCRAGGKDYCDWLKNKSSQEVIRTLEYNKSLENTQDTPASTLQDAKPVIIGLASPPCIFIKTANNTPTELSKIRLSKYIWWYKPYLVHVELLWALYLVWDREMWELGEKGARAH